MTDLLLSHIFPSPPGGAPESTPRACYDASVAIGFTSPIRSGRCAMIGGSFASISPIVSFPITALPRRSNRSRLSALLRPSVANQITLDGLDGRCVRKSPITTTIARGAGLIVTWI